VSGNESRPATSRARQFEEIFSACYPQVLRYAIRRTTERAAAEEAVSETFIVAWRRLDVVPDKPLPWLLGVARKVLANQRRSEERRTPEGTAVSLERVADAELGPGFAEVMADREAFAAAFAALDPREREVLSLVFWDGLAPREVATVLGVTSASVYMRLHRARRRLSRELEVFGHSRGERTKPPVRRPGPDVTEAR
jgi:RNA polymerase sigma-70 factor, ECF subfamily